MSIAENIARIRAEIAEAAIAAGRDPSAITLCAATKMNDADNVRQAIGYKEFVAALNGEISVAEAADQVRIASRHYAKRQLTWFRRNKNIHWITRETGEGADEIFRRARQIAKDFDN